MKRALWWENTDDDQVRCRLCPNNCTIPKWDMGFCAVRGNVEGELISFAYGYPVALQVDPIEKKPFGEFMRGTKTFSLGTYGCNLDCLFCQNYYLSKNRYPDNHTRNFVSPKEIVELALKHNCRSIAFTYNEPTVFAEYAIDIANEAHTAGLATLLISNGYINMEVAEVLYPLIDAANIDMKGFSEDFYRKMTKSHLQPVLEAIKYFHSLSKKHLEITNLIIPGQNDSPELIHRFLDWVEADLNKDIPIHFSAYHPEHNYKHSPTTPQETLHAIYKLASERNFKHLYLGNI